MHMGFVLDHLWAMRGDRDEYFVLGIVQFD